MNLGVTASFLYTLLSASGEPVSLTRRIALTSGQYASWSESDTYVAEAVAYNAGIVPITGLDRKLRPGSVERK